MLSADLHQRAAAQFKAAADARSSADRSAPAVAVRQTLSLSRAMHGVQVDVLDAAYSMLDATVTDLDQRMRLLEGMLRAAGEASGSVAEEAASYRQPGSISSRTRHAASTASSTSAAGGGSAHAGHGHGARASGVGAAALLLRASSSSRGSGGGRMDIAVDPAEPLYCSCRQVAFGDMIACDSPACLTEWYHMQCVGITPATRPAGKWLCPDCARKAAASGSASATSTASNSTRKTHR